MQPRALRGPRSAVTRETDGIGRRLNITAKAYSDWANDRMAPAAIGLIPWVLLRYIDGAPAPGLSQSDLAANFGVGGPTMVGHVDRLSAEGLVRRVRDAADRRVTRLAITADGKARLELGGRYAAAMERDLRAVVGDDNVATFMATLQAIHTYVSSDEGVRA